jgi:hypothetical protein
MVRWAIRQVLEVEAAMLQEVRSILVSANGLTIMQHVRANLDAYAAGGT